MKPEASSANQKSEVASQKSAEAESQKVDNEMTEEEKRVMNILKDKLPMDLNALKEQAGLSSFWLE